MSSAMQEFSFLLVFFIAQRFYELWLTRKNELILKENMSLKEAGISQRRWMTGLHALWFCSLFLEGFYWGEFLPFPYLVTCFLLLLLAQFLRYRSMLDLGVFWSTRVYVFQQSVTIRKGIYQYIKHPNYLAVLIEFIVLPLYFSCWRTLMIFLPLKVLFLFYRVRLENKLHFSINLFWGVNGSHV